MNIGRRWFLASLGIIAAAPKAAWAQVKKLRRKRTLYVSSEGKGGTFRSLSAALKDCDPGDECTVFVMPGHTEILEPTVVTSRVSIIGLRGGPKPVFTWTQDPRHDEANAKAP